MFYKQSCNEKSNKNLFLPYVIRDVNCVCKQPPDDKSMLWCHWKIWGLQEKHVLVFVTSSLTFDTRMIPVWTTFTRSRLLHDAWRLDTYLGSYETFSQNHDISDNHWMKSSLNHYSNKGYVNIPFFSFIAIRLCYQIYSGSEFRFGLRRFCLNWLKLFFDKCNIFLHPTEQISHAHKSILRPTYSRSRVSF